MASDNFNKRNASKLYKLSFEHRSQYLYAFVEGEKDTLKVGRAEMMEKLKTLGVETAVHTLKDAPHPFWMSDPWCAETVDIADAFFKKWLK